MDKGPKVSHPEYVDFNSDEDDFLGDDDSLVDNSSEEYYNEHASIMLIKMKQIKMLRRRWSV